MLLLAKIDDPEVRASYLKDLDVLTRSKLKRDLEKEGAKDSGEVKRRPEALSAEDRRITEELQRALGLKVTMARSSKDPEAGKLSIEFYSSDDLQEVFRKLHSSA